MKSTFQFLTVTAALCAAVATTGFAQSFVHETSDGYVWPTELAVLQNLDKWQDQKFGVIFHWGIYSEPGIMESWTLSSEDREWISRPDNMAYDDYKKWYWGLKDSFNPTQFDPERWAEIMEDAGMKYVVFTTKHHDGFCMYDSKETDFTIAKGVFKDNPLKDVTRHVWDAFRKKEFMIGAYFSKPDWHCEDYWCPYWATPDRNVNYDIKKYPERWKRFCDYTARQINELMTNYGHVDILWLDGGWVCAPDQDIHMDEIADNARRAQPHLLVVDRTIQGRNENYRTPEQSLLEKQSLSPWETCMTLTNHWSHVEGSPCKSANTIIATLVETVAKGGNLLLGVGPTGKGTIDDEVVARLHQIGAWLRVNGEAIYGTRPTPVFHDGNTWFTAAKNGKTRYAVYLLPENGQLPETIEWTGNLPKGKMTLLQNRQKVKYSVEGEKVKVILPKGIRQESLAIAFTPAK